MNRNTVLMLSDDMLVAASLSLCFEVGGYRTSISNSVSELIASSHLPGAKAVISNMLKPNRTERHLADALWQHAPETPLFIISHSRETKEDLRGGPPNVVAIYDSPVDLPELSAIMAHNEAKGVPSVD